MTSPRPWPLSHSVDSHINNIDVNIVVKTSVLNNYPNIHTILVRFEFTLLCILRCKFLRSRNQFRQVPKLTDGVQVISWSQKPYKFSICFLLTLTYINIHLQISSFSIYIWSHKPLKFHHQCSISFYFTSSKKWRQRTIIFQVNFSFVILT